LIRIYHRNFIGKNFSNAEKVFEGIRKTPPIATPMRIKLKAE
jgi:hypothetical protein